MRVQRALAALFVLIALIGQEVTNAQPAGAYPTSTIGLAGHGWGHGRGLSQFGSLGYALAGWSHSQILQHYYSNTVAGTVPNNQIRQRIVGNDGVDLITFSNTPYTVAGNVVAGGQVTRIRRIGANNFAVDRSGGCNGAGGWAQQFTAAGPVVVASTIANPGNDLNLMLERCAPEGTRGYRGTLTAIDDGGTIRTINASPLEDYLRGVVPRESPASWADLGGGAGLNALKAQAVAARSYARASANYSYAETCDTTACQVHGGAFLNGVRIEDNRTDAAIAQTAGEVRLLNGAPARTEFSSSSGGYTAGGTFPAVVDHGDAVAQNPNHNWNATIAVSAVESAYPAIGTLVSIGATARNGLGDFGGRVRTVTMIGTAGTVNVSGDAFRSKFALKSDWFQFLGAPSGGVGGYWQVGTDGGIYTFGSAPFRGSAGDIRLAAPVVGMASGRSDGYWLAATDGGVFSYGSHVFHGSMGGTRLNQPVVGMAAHSTTGYWLVARDGGIFTFGTARFFGSTGNIRLNQPIVGMAPTPSGNGYWLVAADGGVFTFGDAQFFGSAGNIPLRSPVVGMAPTPNGNGYWLVAADGGIFTFGNAPFLGSVPGAGASATITGMARTATGAGYLLTASNGTVYPFGDAPQFGGASTAIPNFRGRVVGISPVA